MFPRQQAIKITVRLQSDAFCTCTFKDIICFGLIVGGDGEHIAVTDVDDVRQLLRTGHGGCCVQRSRRRWSRRVIRYVTFKRRFVRRYLHSA